jgi:hypothetical protein
VQHDWPVVLFSLTNEYYTYTCELLRSAVHAGASTRLAGFRDARKFNWGLGKPLWWITEALEAEIKARGDDNFVAIIVDAHDALIIFSAAKLVARFLSLRAVDSGLRVLVSAERSCFPIAKADCDRFPIAPGGSPYRNLNSGAWMGGASDVLEVLRAAGTLAGPLPWKDNDQAVLQMVSSVAFFNE